MNSSYIKMLIEMERKEIELIKNSDKPKHVKRKLIVELKKKINSIIKENSK